MTMVDAASVLVVDDDEAIRSTEAEILAGLGYSVLEAADGTDALDKLAGRTVDAVVLDIKMPRKDGITVVNELSPQPPPPGIVLISAYNLDPETRQALGPRVVCVLRKPAAPHDLIRAVAEAVEVAKSSQDP